MENKGTKIIAALALVVAVCGVSIGFAAFSNTLTIKSSAFVKPDSSKFDVNFSSSSTDEVAGTVVGTTSVTATSVTATGFTAEDATIDNSGDPTISGLKANFTEPGQKVDYVFYAHNAGEYDAYLNSVVFENVSGSIPAANKVCTAKSGTTQALVDKACGDISVVIKVGSETFDGSKASISGHQLSKAGYEEIKVTIEYKKTSTNSLSDGDFDVAFGDISLVYDSVD